MARRPDWVKVVETAGRRYEVRVHGQRPDGGRFQHRKRFKSVEEAVKWRSTVLSELGHGTHVAPSDLTVKAAVDAWLAGQRIRPSTREGYIANLRPLVDALGGRTVQDIAKSDIEGLVASLLAGGLAFGTWNAPTKLPKARREKRIPLAARTINSALIRWRAVFDDLVAQGVLVRSPAALVKSLPMTKPVLATLDAKQATKLLAATAGDRFGIAWRLALSGLRRGEVLALKWDAIDFTANTLSVTVARVRVAGGSATGEPKTASSTRVLPMPADLAAALKAERKRHREAKLAMGSKWKGTGLVVVDEFGNPPHPDTLSDEWTAALKAARLPHVRLHDARHSCATLMHMRGVPVVAIAAWLGHASAAFTMAVYAHSTDSALADAATTLNSITAAEKPKSRKGKAN